MTNTRSGASGVSGRTAMIALTLVAALAVALAGLATQPAGAEPADAEGVYAVTDLGTFGGPISIARDANDRGQVVGQSQKRMENVPAPQVRAFLWEDGQMEDLGTLGGLTSAGRGLNDRGQVVGFSRDSSNQQRAFVAERGADDSMQLAALDTLSGFRASEAFDVNDPGQIVGRSYNSVSQGRAVMWDKREPQPEDLGVLVPGDTYSEAWAINNSGQVVGESGSDEDHGRAFLYVDGVMQGLGVLSGNPYSEAFDINDRGQVVGWSYSSRSAVQGRAFIYRKVGNDEPKMEDLGALPGDLYSMARGINNKGQVVGQSRDASGQNRAFLWENGQMKDLNGLISASDSSKLKLLDAYAINERGQIVGSATNKETNRTVPFLLTRR